MIILHRFEPPKDAASPVATLMQHQIGSGEMIPADTVWIDLFEPTREERRQAEGFAAIALPTPDEMDEIEPSELLYADGGARYMTARVLCLAKTPTPKVANVSFVRKGRVLVTVRYDDPKPFQIFAQRAQRSGLASDDPEAVFVGLVDTIVGRASEILRDAGDQVDRLSDGIFRSAAEGGAKNADYQRTFAAIGREGGRISKARESLISIELMLRFASQPGNGKNGEPSGHVGTMLRDMESLETHTDHLLGKVQFLLDALLGLVNLKQNDIIKILTVITTVLTPPTFIASFYGMNFKNMPEYDWPYGYPYGIALMVVSAILPFLYFRLKKWL